MDELHPAKAVERPTEVAAEVVAAYLETEYRVHGPRPFVLRVGVASAPLAALHQAHGVEGSAWLTACNPLGARVDDALNLAAQRGLRGELARRGLAPLEGVGAHPSNGWPEEPSFLVPGLARAEAETLGRTLRQDAILWCGADAVPVLVLLR